MKIEQIIHTYAKFSLDIKGIELKDNSIIGLVGANGAGKTTLMSILSGYIEPTISFEVYGYLDKKILFIPSDLEIYEYLTVKEFVGFVLKYSTHKDNLDVDSIIDMLDLREKAEILIEQLSEGMKKKLTLVSIFVKEYDLLILDEPFNSIDLNYIYRLKKFLVDKKKNCCILISSHILDTLSDICDYLIMLEDGRVKKSIINDKNITDLEREIFEKNA